MCDRAVGAGGFLHQKRGHLCRCRLRRTVVRSSDESGYGWPSFTKDSTNSRTGMSCTTLARMIRKEAHSTQGDSHHRLCFSDRQRGHLNYCITL
ncbi:peptide-methionine (R)-S-oxide reductase [Bradyrhizobium japonicum]|uniref:peptide-methionine (R)-S-oxide reductase n=1 Tax=Bradyrhizobium japonicum TaxID=375 RepID=UPI0013747FD6